MSIAKINDASLWMKERREQLKNLTPEARTYKRIRGRARTPEEKKPWSWLAPMLGMNGLVQAGLLKQKKDTDYASDR